MVERDEGYDGNEVSPKKERLIDEEMGNLLASVGNHEAKALTLLVMQSGIIFSRGDLHRTVISAQGDKIGWRMDKNGPFNFCSNSLSPIGLVAKETLNQDLSTYGFQITEYGRDIGVPLAGLLLDFSRRRGVSLNRLFGKTKSSSPSRNIQTDSGEIEFKKRAPLTRFKIFYELATAQDLPIRDADLSERIEESEGCVAYHINCLSENGFITYEAVEVNVPSSFYTMAFPLPKGDVPIYRSQRIRTNSVFEIVKKNKDKYLSSEDIYDLLPKDVKDSSKKKSILGSIVGILSHFQKYNFVSVKKFHFGERSKIDLTSKQRELLTELVEILDGFQNQDPEIITRGRKLAAQIIANPQTVSELFGRAKEASSNANQSPTSETEALVLSVISSNPGITNNQILELLKREGKLIGIMRVQRLTVGLQREGDIEVEKEGILKKFSAKNKTTDSSKNL